MYPIEKLSKDLGIQFVNWELKKRSTCAYKEDEEGNIIVRTNFTDFGTMSDFLEEKKIEVISSETIYLPNTTVALSEEAGNEVLELVAKLEEDDDVQKVYHNLA